MNDELYTKLGFAVFWFIKYIIIPICITVTAIIIADKILQPQPEIQRKKRSHKNRSN